VEEEEDNKFVVAGRKEDKVQELHSDLEDAIVPEVDDRNFGDLEMEVEDVHHALGLGGRILEQAEVDNSFAVVLYEEDMAQEHVLPSLPEDCRTIHSPLYELEEHQHHVDHSSRHAAIEGDHCMNGEVVVTRRSVASDAIGHFVRVALNSEDGLVDDTPDLHSPSTYHGWLSSLH
jgi:hypothetical protein